MAGSPTARRRRLSIELKKLRETSGFTCAQVGEALDWSGSKVNRMETGSGRVQPSDIDALCRFYGTSDELREFLKSLARQAKTRGWWQVHGAGVPEWFNIYIGLEQDASTWRGLIDARIARQQEDQQESPLYLTCGIDRAEDHHDVAMVDQDARLLGKLRIGDDASGFQDLLPCWPSAVTVPRTRSRSR